MNQRRNERSDVTHITSKSFNDDVIAPSLTTKFSIEIIENDEN